MIDLKELEAITNNPDQVFAELRRLTIEEVGRLLLHVPDKFSGLQAILPSMPEDKVQIAWTGSSGEALLTQSLNFVSFIEAAFLKYAGKTLSDKTILDYGCGWGRLIRLMYKFSPPDKIYGCDPWGNSIDFCKKNGIRANLAVSDYVPQNIPFIGVSFDLIYAFSVFTHLSEKTAKAALGALRKTIGQDGLLVITIRPIEYWDVHSQNQSIVDRIKMKEDHESKGFAFTAHDIPPIDGEITYGDASVSIPYIKDTYDSWEVVGEERGSVDPYQTICYLKPR